VELDDSVDNAGVRARAIRGNANDPLEAVRLCGAQVAAHHVIERTTVARNAGRFRRRLDWIVLGIDARGYDDGVERTRASQPHDDVLEDRVDALVRQGHEHLPWQAR